MRKGFLCAVAVFSTIMVNAQVVVPADSVSNYVGKIVTAFGQVKDGRYLSGPGKSPTLLNLGAKYPNQKMTVVIFGEDRGNFGYKPEVALLNKTIYVKGKVELYDDKPQIIVTSPFDISFNPPANAVMQAPVITTRIPETTVAPKKDVQPQKARIEDVRAAEIKQPKERKEAKEKGSTINTAVTMPVAKQQLPPVAGDIVLENTLSLKGGPGNKFVTIGSLKKGTAVTVISSGYGWAKIAERTNENTLRGYVKLENLQAGN